MGGAIVSILESFIFIGGDSKVTFHNNNSTDTGGAVSFQSKAAIIFTGNSTVVSNIAGAGGGIHLVEHCIMSFTWNSAVEFNSNTATKGGSAIYNMEGCSINYKESSLTIFTDNKAPEYGAICSGNGSDVILNSEVIFNGEAFVYKIQLWFLKETTE